MSNDERLERIIRIDEAVSLFQQRFLPETEKDWVRERFDQHDRHSTTASNDAASSAGDRPAALAARGRAMGR